MQEIKLEPGQYIMLGGFKCFQHLPTEEQLRAMEGEGFKIGVPYFRTEQETLYDVYTILPIQEDNTYEAYGKFADLESDDSNWDDPEVKFTNYQALKEWVENPNIDDEKK